MSNIYRIIENILFFHQGTFNKGNKNVSKVSNRIYLAHIYIVKKKRTRCSFTLIFLMYLNPLKLHVKIILCVFFFWTGHIYFTLNKWTNKQTNKRTQT